MMNVQGLSFARILIVWLAVRVNWGLHNAWVGFAPLPPPAFVVISPCWTRLCYYINCQLSAADGWVYCANKWKEKLTCVPPDV